MTSNQLTVYVDSCGNYGDTAAGAVILNGSRVLWIGVILPHESVWNIESGGIHIMRKIVKPFALDYDIEIYNDNSAVVGKNYKIGERGIEPISRQVLYESVDAYVTLKWATKRHLFKNISNSGQFLDVVESNQHKAGIWLADKLGRNYLQEKQWVLYSTAEISAFVTEALQTNAEHPTLAEIVHELWHIRYQDEEWKSPPHNYIDKWLIRLDGEKCLL